MFENEFRLRAIVGSRSVITSEHRKLHHNFRRAACAQPSQGEIALAGFRFGQGQRLAHFGPRVIGKRLAADAENRVADRENAVSGRIIFNLGDCDLAGIGCDHLLTTNPASQARGTEIPVVLRAYGRA